MGFFSVVSLWKLFAGTVLISVLFYEIGFKFGKFRCSVSRDTKDAHIGTMIGSTFGLLAFLLAFTFGIASSHFDARKTAFLEDTNSIRSVYLKSRLLPEPARTKIKELLKDYIDIRLRMAHTTSPKELRELLSDSEKIHDQLWSEAVSAEINATGASSSWLFTDKLDEMIAKHFTRIAVALRPRIPGTIWIVLYVVALLSMSAAGYQSGLSGARGSFVFLISCVAFSLILVLIADLDRPKQGLFKVNQQQLADLRNRIAS